MCTAHPRPPGGSYDALRVLVGSRTERSRTSGTGQTFAPPPLVPSSPSSIPSPPRPIPFSCHPPQRTTDKLNSTGSRPTTSSNSSQQQHSLTPSIVGLVGLSLAHPSTLSPLSSALANGPSPRPINAAAAPPPQSPHQHVRATPTRVTPSKRGRRCPGGTVGTPSGAGTPISGTRCVGFRYFRAPLDDLARAARQADSWHVRPSTIAAGKAGGLGVGGRGGSHPAVCLTVRPSYPLFPVPCPLPPVTCYLSSGWTPPPLPRCVPPHPAATWTTPGWVTSTRRQGRQWR